MYIRVQIEVSCDKYSPSCSGNVLLYRLDGRLCDRREFFEITDSDVAVTVDLTAAQTTFEKLTDALDNARDGDAVALSDILPESEKR